VPSWYFLLKKKSQGLNTRSDRLLKMRWRKIKLKGLSLLPSSLDSEKTILLLSGGKKGRVELNDFLVVK
jgi:hypothetical protein